MAANTTHADDTRDTTRRSTDGLWTRIRTNPQPALRWGVVAAVLVVLELGALTGGILTLVDALVMGVTGLIDVIVGLVSPALAGRVVDVQLALSTFIEGVRSTAQSLPTLLSRDVIPNQGYNDPSTVRSFLGLSYNAWTGPFLGLSPAAAWAIRMALTLAYSLFTFYWLYRGWLTFRTHYRRAGWTPRDDMVNRLRNHSWGKFGIVVLVLFLTMSLFGTTLAPSTVQQNITASYGNEVQYVSADTGAVETIPAGEANFNSKSKGNPAQNVGVMTYDDYGRFHPFGTLPNGRDLFTYMMGGAETTLMVTGIAIGMAGFIAALLALVSSYYGGTVDLSVLTLADGIVSIPQLLLLIMVSVVFQDHWLKSVFNGGLLLALVFGLTTWPVLWRSLRGPALQVAEEEWVDAAKSFGQQPTVTMRKHMLPYVLGYLLIYASMTVGGIVIAMASLSFLGNGLGITPPTPAWGRAISQGQPYVSSASWHIALIPGLIIVVLVTGANALGDGIRDAIDPESEGGSEEEAAATGGGA
ncbi:MULTISPECIES: ABC transporter permease [Halobacterium]|uniref:ABC transporter permease n=1 Tax=Halobacterium TaxID=2239 RepID=UPI001965966D|nr:MULTISPECIES: ABC transporter permease [Halobacterium]MCF2207175.1 ABC transporter permease [Halobacterium salinarum]MCF2241057.1 ABC transporter permease [Halobacterium salinarum]QRY22513.1 ABC transporter permease [Halobacterium sp. GSL-19]QRY24578.1 ABC transporter permease [Halobacterium sp. BOL4-2]